MDEQKFRVEILEEAKLFLDSLDEKSRNKIVYNIWKAQRTNDKELFKKLQERFGSLGLNTTKLTSAFLPFGTRLTKKTQLWFRPTE